MRRRRRLSVSSGGGSSSGAASAGARRTHPSLPGSDPAPAQTTSPLAHSSSSCAGDVVAHASRQDSVSSALAGIAAPASCSIARASASTPRRRAALPAAQPVGQEAGERAERHRLDLAAQLGQAAPAQHPQHLGVTPLQARARRAGTRRTGSRPAAASRSSGAGHERRCRGRSARRRRAATKGPCVRAKRLTRSPNGSLTGSRNTSGTPTGMAHAECVAQPAGIFDGDPALLAGDPHAQRPAGGFQLGQQRLDGAWPSVRASAGR